MTKFINGFMPNQAPVIAGISVIMALDDPLNDKLSQEVTVRSGFLK